MTSLLIKNGTIITDGKKFNGDILIEGETISKISSSINQTVDNIIDAKEKLIFPGGIDPHTHMELPVMGTTSSDSFESGTRAAVIGGTTTIIDFANQTKGQSPISALTKWHQKADSNCYTDYSFHVSITDINTDFNIKALQAEGVNSFKTFLAYDAMKLTESDLQKLMKEVVKNDGMVTAHAENGEKIDRLIAEAKQNNQLAVKYHAQTRPAKMEAEATEKYVELSQLTGCPLYIVHMSCKGAVDAIKDTNVLGETCIQYLILDDSKYEEEFELSSKYVLSPPLRSKSDVEAIWQGLQDGTIKVVATDHCPFTSDQRIAGKNDFTKIPNGIPGVENRVELLYSEGVSKNRISEEKFVDLISTNAAKIFGLYPQKGTLQVGSDADIVIFDPQKKHFISSKTHHMNCDYSVYEGMQVTGKCETVILRGNIAYQNDSFSLEKGYGKFLKRI